ncbi:MAG: c-type cytochrome, partial [Acidobacteriaceae bacterium]|nr:c-type cytochrome [Acidobacteriaceae bacterium]
GGSAFDPETGLLYVNANDIPWTSSLTENTGGNSGRNVYLRNCATCHGENRAGAPPQIPSLLNISAKRSAADLRSITRQGAGRMPGFPNLKTADVDALISYLITGENKELQSHGTPTELPKYRFTGYHKFFDPDGYPAVVPPWGTLNAINLNTGDYAWRIPFGDYPELAAEHIRTTGTENYGGPLVTAGGLVFIAATNFDRKARAFDKRTGKLLWQDTLPMSGNATPATYEINGRQYVVFHANGGKARKDEPSGGIYVAYTLP